jgi:hypothetical protein
MDFGRLSGEDLEATLLRLRKGERRLEVQVLLGLIELDRRKLFLDWGYASLFAYCVERLGYCESSAGRRIAAARAMRRFPRIEGMLLSGEARLSAVAMVAVELERDESVLEEIRGKTLREVEEVLARRGKIPRRRDHVRAVSATAWEFRFTAGRALREKFERAKAILSTKHPEGVACEQVVEAALDEYLKRHDPTRPAASAGRAGSPRGSRRRSRAIPAAVRRAVWRRDEGRCAYRSEGGRRCGSTWNLEIDHVKLFCRGGPHREENLRLLCAPHNRREAERSLGQGWMRRFYCLRE